MVLADVQNLISSGAVAQDLLETLGIVTNRNPIPFDPLPANVGSGLRFGSPAMTTRGWKETEFHRIGILVARALTHHETKSILDEVRQEVADLVSDYPLFASKWIPKGLTDDVAD